MQSPTKKITTKLSQTEVELKDWVSVEEAEYIDDATFSGLEITAKGNRPEMGKIDVTKIMVEEKHRLIEKFVVSVNGSTEKILETVMALPELDGQEIIEEISHRRPKKKLSDQPGQ